MAGANPQRPAGRSLSDTLATLPNLSDKIIKTGEQYCEAGAFGDVYKCQYDNDAGRVQVAVKSFRFPFTVDGTEHNNDENSGVKVQKMIRRELGIWRRLKHPNIVPFLGIAYGFGRQGHASLVSLWMHNESLQRFLMKHDDQLTIAHRLQLLSDIANGLCYLHSYTPSPIIHGDLSSNNVLLDDNYIACLTDFGYASMIGDMPEASLYLQMSTMKPGTLRFAAPDPFLADEGEKAQPTIQSDMYSFGNLGLLVLSGKLPWAEIQHDAGVIVQLSRGKKPERPSSRPIEDQHWELIERCWSSIGDRPPVEVVVLSLQQFLHSFPSPRVSFHSIRPAEQNTGTLEPNAKAPDLSKVTLDYQNGVFRDGIANGVVTCDLQQNTGIRRSQEVTDSISQRLDPVPGNSSAAVVSGDAPRTRKGGPHPTAPVVSDENYHIVSEQKVQDLGDITTQQQSGKSRWRLLPNRGNKKKGNKKDPKGVGANKDAGHGQVPVSLTMPQTCHVIFMGETGSGKSSLIGMIADYNHALVSPDGRPCTSPFVSYDVSIEGRTYRLWDSPGFTKASKSWLLRRFNQATESSLELFLQERHRRGQLDLFVLCMRGNRTPAEMSEIYNIFCRTNRYTAIPVVVAVTHLEKVKPTMDAWWQNNERELANRGMAFDGHACLTCLSPHRLRDASQQAIRRLISTEYQPRALPERGGEALDDPGKSCTIC